MLGRKVRRAVVGSNETRISVGWVAMTVGAPSPQLNSFGYSNVSAFHPCVPLLSTNAEIMHSGRPPPKGGSSDVLELVIPFDVCHFNASFLNFGAIRTTRKVIGVI
jgi:hypothetical protein